MNNLVLKSINPISYQEYEITLKYYNIDYKDWLNIDNIKSDKDLINKLNYLLKCLDCTIIYDFGRNCILNSPLYELRSSEYYYYLLKFKNQILYNLYIDKYIKQHNKNILFDFHNPICVEPKKKKPKAKKGFIKQESRDLFSGEITYQYVNLSTNEIITSNDPNLLETLNKPKVRIKKEKVTKVTSVPLSSMTFNFKKHE